MANRYFRGLVDDKWNNSGNWASSPGGAGGAGVPTASDDVYLDDGEYPSTITVDVNATCLSISITGIGLGLVLDLNGYDLAIGSGGFSITSETFIGGSGSITVSGNVSITGGTFTSTSGTFEQAGGDLQVSIGGSFSHNSGTWKWFGGTGTPAVNVGSAIFNNVWFAQSDTWTLTGSWDINGKVTFANANVYINTGTLLLGGDVELAAAYAGGTALYKFDGGGAQELHAGKSGGSGNFGAVEIAKSGGTLTVWDSIYNRGDFTYTSGTVDFATNGGVWVFAGSGATAINSGSLHFDDLQIDRYDWVATITGTVYVDGKFKTISCSSSAGGTIEVAGDVDLSDDVTTGSTVLKIAGNANQTVESTAGTGSWPAWEFASTGGTVTATDILRVWGGNFTYTSGTVDFSGATFEWRGASTIDADPASVAFGNVSFNASATYTLSDDLNIDGTFTFTAGDFSGDKTVRASGDIVFIDNYTSGWTLRVDGSGNQSISAGGGTAGLDNIEFASTGGTITFDDDYQVRGDLVFISGDVDLITNSVGVTMTLASTISTGPIEFYDFTISAGGTFDIVGILIVANDFTISTGYTINGGNIEVHGDLNSSDSSVGGTCTITLAGTGTQTITIGTNRLPDGNLIIDKPSGSAILAAALTLDGTGQDLTIIEGTLDLAGYDLSVDDVFDCDDDGRLKLKGTETLSRTTIVQDGTIEFYDSGVTAVVTNYGSTFNNMIFGASKTHQFANGVGSEITVNGILESAGTSSTRAVLRSDSDGSQWYIDLRGSSILENKADVKDSNAGSGNDIYAIGSLDSGNNSSEWIFTAAGGGGGGTVIGSPIIRGVGA